MWHCAIAEFHSSALSEHELRDAPLAEGVILLVRGQPAQAVAFFERAYTLAEGSQDLVLARTALAFAALSAARAHNTLPTGRSVRGRATLVDCDRLVDSFTEELRYKVRLQNTEAWIGSQEREL